MRAGPLLFLAEGPRGTRKGRGNWTHTQETGDQRRSLQTDDQGCKTITWPSPQQISSQGRNKEGKKRRQSVLAMTTAASEHRATTPSSSTRGERKILSQINPSSPDWSDILQSPEDVPTNVDLCEGILTQETRESTRRLSHQRWNSYQVYVKA